MGPVRRVVNSVGIVFKGSGFYITDNRNGSGPSSSTNGNGKSAPEKKESQESGSVVESDKSGAVAEKKIEAAS
jgi:hypothetical protein